MIYLPKKADKNDVENFITTSFLYKRFRLLLLNQFEWKGPEKQGIDEADLEKWLFENGCFLAFEDRYLGPMCLSCYGEGELNVYGRHTKYRATGFNYSETYTSDESVLVRNNKLYMPTHDAVVYYVNQLYDLVRTLQLNVRQLRLQTLFTADDKNVLTVKKIIDEIDKFNWAIITDRRAGHADEIVKAVPTGVKCLTAELTDRYNAVMNEALTYFGFNNANTDKRERLITDEANANNQLIDSCAEVMLEARKKACDEINDKFGWGWSVDFRTKREEGVKQDDRPDQQPTAEQ